MIHIMQICVVSFEVLQMLPFYLLMDSHQESISNCTHGAGVAEKFWEIYFRGKFWFSFKGTVLKKMQIFLGNNGLKVKRKVGTIKGWGTLGAFSIIHLSKFPTPAVTPTFLPLHLLSCKCQNLKHICLNFQMYLSKFENYLLHFLYISKV